MRTLSPAVQAAIAAEAVRFEDLLRITLPAETLRYGSGAATRTIAGDGNYLPYLAERFRVTQSKTLRTDSVEVRVVNVDGTVRAKLLEARPENRECALYRYFVDAGEAVELFRGRLRELEAGEREIRFRVVAPLDPGSADLAPRIYAHDCQWVFKSQATCGYTDGVDPNDPGTGLPFTSCPKTLAACQARGRQHRFGGFVYITRELQEQFPPSPPRRGGDGGPFGPNQGTEPGAGDLGPHNRGELLPP